MATASQKDRVEDCLVLDAKAHRKNNSSSNGLTGAEGPNAEVERLGRSSAVL